MSFSFKEIFKPANFIVPDKDALIKIVQEEPTIPRTDFQMVREMRNAGPTRSANLDTRKVSLPETKLTPASNEARIFQPERVLEAPEFPLPVVQPAVEKFILPEPKKSDILSVSQETITQVLTESPTRALFDFILEDVANLVKTGKDLEALNKLREEEGGNSQLEEGIISDVEIANEKLTQEISRLLNPASDKDLDKEFKTVKESYLAAYEALEKLTVELKAKNRLADNKLLIQIQTRKQEINKIMKSIGGTEIFTKVKDFVKRSEARQIAFEMQSGAKGFAKNVSQAIYAFLNENKEDIAVVRDIARSGSKTSMIDIITLMAMSKTDYFKITKN